jgi:hypothetical protein
MTVALEPRRGDLPILRRGRCGGGAAFGRATKPDSPQAGTVGSNG